MSFKQVWALLDVHYRNRQARLDARQKNIAQHKDKAFPVVDVGRVDF